MNSRERIEAVVQLDVPDRVPLAPQLDHFAATYTGISNHELMYDPAKRIAAILKVMRELGPWDMTFLAEMANGPLLQLGFPMKMMRPGYELPANEIHQFIEHEVMLPQDYDRTIDIGIIQFREELLRRIYTGGGELEAVLTQGLAELSEAPYYVRAVEKEGSCVAFGGFVQEPCEFLSYARSFPQFCLDLYDYPDKILATVKSSIRESLDFGAGMVDISGVKRAFIGLSRNSPAFMSPKHFEMLVLPFLETGINEMAAAGITALLHCDTDWTSALHYFRRFPRRACILQLDGATNIFEAKKIVGDTMCIMGDIPATLLAFGCQEEVRAYCRKLIEVVGRGGGLILSSGCSIPANAKPENLKAMYEAVEEYGWY